MSYNNYRSFITCSTTTGGRKGTVTSSLLMLQINFILCTMCVFGLFVYNERIFLQHVQWGNERGLVIIIVVLTCRCVAGRISPGQSSRAVVVLLLVLHLVMLLLLHLLLALLIPLLLLLHRWRIRRALGGHHRRTLGCSHWRISVWLRRIRIDLNWN